MTWPVKSTFISIFFICVCGTAALAQADLHSRIADIAKDAKGIVGVSVLGLEDHDTLNYNGNAQMVMQSVMKFPIAMAYLHLVDSGVMNLDQPVKIKKRDFEKNTNSPLHEKYPKGGVVPLHELITDMISYSDNDACDVLLDKIGGPDAVNTYLRSVKIRGINISASESDMAKAWEVQYTNWCKPVDMVRLLHLFYSGKALKPDTRDFLYKIMVETATGPNRIKGMLPAGTLVAHKTGSSGTNEVGVTPATNDVGIITLPDGKHVAVAIFVCNSTASEQVREQVIARIAKAVYDHEIRK